MKAIKRVSEWFCWLRFSIWLWASGRQWPVIEAIRRMEASDRIDQLQKNLVIKESHPAQTKADVSDCESHTYDIPKQYFGEQIMHVTGVAKSHVGMSESDCGRSPMIPASHWCDKCDGTGIADRSFPTPKDCAENEKLTEFQKQLDKKIRGDSSPGTDDLQPV